MWDKFKMEYEGDKAVWQWFIFSLTSASHPKERGFWSHGCNMSGWREAVWSSLPIAPLGLSSSPPHQLLHQSQGRERARGRTGDNVCTPSLFFARRPARPDPPPKPSSFLATLLDLCSPAPALSFLCPSRFGVAMRDEWGVAPVLCWPGFTATAHRLPSARPYIGLSLHPSHPLVGRGGLTLHAIPHIVSI